MQEGLSIRRATRADRAVVLNFHRALYVAFRDEIADPKVIPLFAYRDIEGALRDDVDALLYGDDTVVLIAERDGVAVGYISGHMEHDPRRVLTHKGVVEDWYVVQSERRQGTGMLLLDTLLEGFKEAGCDVAESATWGFNEGARAAHERAGFHEIEVRYRRRL
jgi:GNAT superfamily N-acetyltransferase